jgi:hypothetical protein
MSLGLMKKLEGGEDGGTDVGIVELKDYRLMKDTISHDAGRSPYVLYLSEKVRRC